LKGHPDAQLESRPIMVWVKSKGSNTAGSWRHQSDREMKCGGLASTIRAHDGCNVAF
jgi:hypothetical protein